jgi:hypothetical protein
MDVTTLITAATSSLGISAATAAWLSRKLVSHRLDKDLETFKSELEKERTRDQATLEARIHEQVETSLGDLAAQREYSLEARKRLYTAIGPLRFQLLVACRDLGGRISSHGLGRVYDLEIEGYYGRTTLFRILRPLCLSELIERQVAYADFAVDSGAVDLLRFKKAAFAALCGGSLVEGHPGVDWHRETQHVFFDHIAQSANALVVEEASGHERALRSHEFDTWLHTRKNRQALSPFPELLGNMTPVAKPLLWTRLVAYGNLCNEFVNKTGNAIGFEVRTYPIAELLSATHDPTISDNLAEYVRRCEFLAVGPL